MRKFVISTALALAAMTANAQEDCANMANRWSDVFTNAPAIETMTSLFLPNALVFGTLSKDIGTKTDDVVAYFTPVYARKIRTKNFIKSQHVIKAGDNAWIIAGLYDFHTVNPEGVLIVTPARYHFVVVRDGSQCKIAAFNSSRVPN